MDIAAYCASEIARLTALETELREQLMAVRGGLTAYQDVLAQMDADAPQEDA